jgi:hypothetical protein
VLDFSEKDGTIGRSLNLEEESNDVYTEEQRNL